MQIIKATNGEWQRTLQATCNNCLTTVEALFKKPFRGKKCQNCGHFVDKVYVD